MPVGECLICIGTGSGQDVRISCVTFLMLIQWDLIEIKIHNDKYGISCHTLCVYACSLVPRPIPFSELRFVLTVNTWMRRLPQRTENGCVDIRVVVVMRMEKGGRLVIEAL